jgi:hypothetical protein
VVITEEKVTPTVMVSPTSAILTCANPSATLTASGGSTYSWTATNGYTANTAIANIILAGTYTVTASSLGGCTSTASVVITEDKALPTATITGSATVCTGETLSLTVTGGGTYAWVGPNTFSSTTAIISLPNATNSLSGTYTVMVTNANGCTATATTLVTVNAVPTTPTVQTNVNIPIGTSITLTATGCTGTLLWFKATNNSSVIMPIAPTDSSTYYAKCAVTVNNITCIGQASGNVVVTVGPMVVVSIKTGDWEDPTTWNVGRLPLVSEEVTIDTFHIVTITNNTATAKKIIYKNNSTLRFANTAAKLTLGSL